MDVDGVEAIVDMNQSILGVRTSTLSNINVSGSLVGTMGGHIEEEVARKDFSVMFILARIQSVLGVPHICINSK